jgi:hypothetical protein
MGRDSEAATIHFGDPKSNATPAWWGGRGLCYWRGVSRASVCFWAALVAVWCWAAAPAQAYEDQASLDAELGYGNAVSDSVPAHGVLLGVGASLGLSDLFTLRGELSWALHPGSSHTLSVFFASAELLYLIDIFELVPYFGVGIDGIGAWTSGAPFSTDLGAHPVLGLDWLISRRLTLGLQLRSVFLLTALSRDPVYLRAGASLSYLFDL